MPMAVMTVMWDFDVIDIAATVLHSQLIPLNRCHYAEYAVGGGSHHMQRRIIVHDHQGRPTQQQHWHWLL